MGVLVDFRGGFGARSWDGFGVGLVGWSGGFWGRIGCRFWLLGWFWGGGF